MSAKETKKHPLSDTETGAKIPPQNAPDADECTAPPGGRPIMVRDVRTAKRLLGKIILQIQRGSILSDTARLLTYCLSTYVAICKENDFEERLVKIENEIRSKGVPK